ncbi:MAG: formate/nitrite transporter family protein, partial [Clostridiales bacterium]|nr:formate/nitrite transporter family protein [Clostridiales bacterium]
YRCQNELSKIVVLWLSITVFALSGTEHVVANVYYLFTAYFAGADISLTDIVYRLILSGIGNFIGGGVIVSGLNYIMAHKDIQKSNRLH